MNQFAKQVEDTAGSTLKRTTFVDRLKNAINAFHCKPVSTIHMGMEVHRCDQCEHKNPNQHETMMFYICDRKACNPCNNPDCKYTPKIEHAKNFKSNAELGMNNGYSDYWEVERAIPEVVDKIVKMLLLFCDDDDQISIKKCELDANIRSILEDFK